MELKKLISSFALSAMMLASVVGVCRMMMVSCGFDCGATAMTEMHSHGHADTGACEHGVTSCTTTPSQDHMSTFASMYPSITADSLALFLIVTAAYVCARAVLVLCETQYREKLRVTLRYLRWRFSKSITSEYLVLAYSRGVLNPKFYA